MILSNDIKNKIHEEFNRWVDKQYANTTKEERKELQAVFTPPDVSIKMIEMADNLDGTILDPCCGAGGLIAACIIAGADPKKCYGNEFEERFVEVARTRLGELGVPWYHIHQGDATQKNALEITSFTPDYRMHPDNEKIALF